MIQAFKVFSKSNVFIEPKTGKTFRIFHIYDFSSFSFKIFIRRAGGGKRVETGKQKVLT